MLRVVETFSGIGSQAQALKNIKADYKVEAIVEWEIGAMYAYDIIHNGPQDLSIYRHHTRETLIRALSRYTISGDGKEPLSERALLSMNTLQMRAILCAINRNNNLVDITKVKAETLPEADLLTYSFPCQDLSVSGHWHNNTGGIDREANNRSTLLWQIERILNEYVEADKELPRFLLMENVSNILAEKHIKNFNEWRSFLDSLGYHNQIYTLDARDFGVPQSRKRTYMLSVRTEDSEIKKELENYFFYNDLENRDMHLSEYKLSDYLRTNYDIEKYRREALESTPVYTPSREKIFKNNPILAKDRIVDNTTYARTITTKQDRNPNSGIIAYEQEVLTAHNPKYRNLTPRECFLLMGFDEEQFDVLMENNIIISNEGERKILPTARLVRLAGNSIVVQVLEKIFEQVIEINETILIKEKVEKNLI